MDYHAWTAPVQYCVWHTPADMPVPAAPLYKHGIAPKNRKPAVC